MGILEWDSYLCRAFIGLDEMLIVKLSPCEDITPVAEVIRAVGETIPKNDYITWTINSLAT